MSIYLDLIEQFSEKIIKKLFLISSSGEIIKSFRDNSQKIIENLKGLLVRIKYEKNESEKLEDQLRVLDSDLFKFQIQFEDTNKNFQDLQNRIRELKSEIDTIKGSHEEIDNNLSKSKEELENIKSKLKILESNLSAKESEKEVLEQKKKDNEEKHRNALLTYSRKLDDFKIKINKNLEEFDKVSLDNIKEIKDQWSKKLIDLEKQFNDLKRDNFFTLFLIENYGENIPELEIISILAEKQNCNLDELKNQIDLPPILAIRTIKQMEVKAILKIDEESYTVSISEEFFR